MSHFSYDELMEITLAIMRHINVDIHEPDLEAVDWVDTSSTKYSLALIVQFVEAHKRNEVWRASKNLDSLYSDEISDIKDKLANQKLIIRKTIPQPNIRVVPATSDMKIRRPNKRSAEKSANNSAKKIARKTSDESASTSAEPN